MKYSVLLTILAAWLSVASKAAAQPPSGDDAKGVEFFEKRIRPIFEENCYGCHGPKKQKAGLRLDRPSGIRAGGENGPVIAAGNPDASRLIEAVSYTNVDLQMPPKGKLSDARIADLVAWVKQGAPLPQTDGSSIAAVAKDFNLAERIKHWAYAPVGPVALPAVKDPAWCASPIDRFILARLEEAGLAPAAPADRRTLIRRVTFDLTGLPPTPAEVASFVTDDSPDAYARLVDRLLASPRYGERWARHWLDLVRYSDTMGYEYDFDLYNAWRYRDYVIRAFNDDLPYDQFVQEHLAGDLLPHPRRNRSDGSNESILATGFFLFGEGKQSPVDVRLNQADRIDNQIDVLGKAFLGQTLACARCHDHKFDAVSTRDYYALAGYLKSSRFQQAFIDGPERIAARATQLADLRAKIASLAAAYVAPRWRRQSKFIARYLLASRLLLSGEPETSQRAADVAQAAGLEPARLARWTESLQEKEVDNPDHPLYFWRQLASPGKPDVDQTEALRIKMREQASQVSRSAKSYRRIEDFAAESYNGWRVTGDAFGAGPTMAGAPIVGESLDRPIARLAFAGAHSGMLSNRLQGEMRSETFTIERPYLHIRLAGRNTRVNLVIDGYTLIMTPIYDGLTIVPKSERPAWQTIDVTQWQGHRAYLEISDSTIPMHTNPPRVSDGTVPANPVDAYVVVQQICVSDSSVPPPPAPNHLGLEALETANDVVGLADAYQSLVQRELDRWNAGKEKLSADGADLLDWMLRHGLLDDSEHGPPQEAHELAALLEQYRQIEAALPEPLRAPAIADGTGEDEFVFVRGNYKTPGELSPRRPPEFLAGQCPALSASGSGRLELARRLTEPSNPLLARVLVNRLWQHHFGVGIVGTPDDFGRMGEPPTHPELLDYLAAEFVRQGFSIKKMHRLMLLSSTYRMSSHRIAESERHDPEDLLLHRMRVQRLEGEAVRDAILAVAGRLNNQMYGPGVLPYLTAHMEGRGRPKSGPLDGDGRRSIYLNVRRNFLTPLLTAFDYPVAFSTTGRRSVSSVPAQALELMNDPFVVQEAGRWAERTLAGPSRGDGQRITSLYEAAYARPPSAEELGDAMQFLAEQRPRHQNDEGQTWSDLCHVLINVKEFYVVP